MKRVIVVGPGAAGKSTLAARLSEITIRRSPECADFWTWLLLYRRRSRPVLRQAIAAHAGDADVYVLPTPRAVRRFVAQIASGVPDSP